MGDSSLLHSAPLYYQAMGLTVPERLAHRLYRANCYPISLVLTNKIAQLSMEVYCYGLTPSQCCLFALLIQRNIK